MVERLQVYRCKICGNIVQVLHAGGGTLVCCGEDMTPLQENTVEASKEKHIPVIEKKGDVVVVRLGSVPHPMDEKHYIEWIELLADGISYFQYLKPGMKPEATFDVKAEKVMARAYCNLHGLWKSA
jgi:superoxide reductase